MSDPAPPPLHRDRQIIAAVVGAVVGAIVAGITAAVITSPSGSATNTGGPPLPATDTTTSAASSSAPTTSTNPSATAATKLAYMDTATDTSQGVETGDAKVNGTVRPDSLYVAETCLPNYGYVDKTRNITFDLDRRNRRLRTTVGLRDDSSEAALARMTVYGDRRRLAGADVRLGKPATLNVDVTGVLRLRLELTWLDGFDCPLPNRRFMTAVWATPTIS